MTSQHVAQYLNHCTTACPRDVNMPTQNYLYRTRSSVSLKQSVMFTDPKITHLNYAPLVMVATNFCTESYMLKVKVKVKTTYNRPGLRWMINTILWPLNPQGGDLSIHCTDGWVGPRISLDGCGKSCINQVDWYHGYGATTPCAPRP
jgi:hypothetical protein